MSVSLVTSPHGASSSSAAATARSMMVRVSMPMLAIGSRRGGIHSRRPSRPARHLVGAEVRADRHASRARRGDQGGRDLQQVLVLELRLGDGRAGRRLPRREDPAPRARGRPRRGPARRPPTSARCSAPRENGSARQRAGAAARRRDCGPTARTRRRRVESAGVDAAGHVTGAASAASTDRRARRTPRPRAASSTRGGSRRARPCARPRRRRRGRGGSCGRTGRWSTPPMR